MSPGNMAYSGWLLSLISETYLELSFCLIVWFCVRMVSTVAVVEVRATSALDFFFFSDFVVTAE